MMQQPPPPQPQPGMAAPPPQAGGGQPPQWGGIPPPMTQQYGAPPPQQPPAMWGQPPPQAHYGQAPPPQQYYAAPPAPAPAPAAPAAADEVRTLWIGDLQYWMDENYVLGCFLSTGEEPGRPEADFGRYDVKRVVRTVYVLFSKSEIPIAKEDQEIMDLADLSTPLPEWFSEDDLAVYASLYEKSGFRYPMEMPYRSLHKRKPIEDPKFQVPVFVVIGEKDYVFKFPGVESVLKDGIMEKFAPDLKITYIPEGSHFVQEQFPDKVNDLLVSFLKDHSVDA